MRILHILSQIEVTGAEVHALELADYQIQQGHDVYIVSNALHRPTRAIFISKEIHTKKIFVRLRNRIWLNRFLKEKKIDVVHSHSRAAVRVAWGPCQRQKIPLISTVHGRQHFSWSKRVFDSYGDRVIAVCENIRQHLIQDFRMNARKMVVIGNPLALAEKSWDREKIEKLALVGRLTGPKGERALAIMKNVIPTILRNYPQIKFFLVGGADAKLSEQLLSCWRDLEIAFPGRIFFERISGLEKALTKYDLVMGAGRIAVSALLHKMPIVAIGEATYLGPIRSSNFENAVSSNFGDVFAEENEATLNFDEISKDLSQIIEAPMNAGELERLQTFASKYFERTIVGGKIMEVYRSAIFQKKVPRNIPVLMYHMVTEQDLDVPHRIFVTKNKFQTHLQYLAGEGFVGLHFKDLVQFKNGLRDWSEFPKKPVILTFDDGYRNNLELALPLLEEYKIKATVFLLADSDVTTNVWNQGEMPEIPLLNSNERKTLAQSEFIEIGSHGFRHESLTKKSIDEASEEMTASRVLLEKEFGVPICAYAYAYGESNNRLSELAQSAGYQYSVNTDTGGLHIEENPHSVFRVSVFPQDDRWAIRKKTAWWYRKYFYLKRGH